MHIVQELLRARGLTKRYGNVVALDRVDFAVTEGVTGLLGPNGAGKSTSIKLFLGLTKPTDGTAEMLGETAATNVAVRARVGYMPEHDCLPPNVSAAEFLAHMAGCQRPAARARARARAPRRSPRRAVRGALPADRRLLDGHEAAREARAGARPRSRARLPRRAANWARPGRREDMLALIRKTHREFGISLLFSSHIMGDIERTCDRILVLDDGRVVHEGAVSELHASETQTVYVEVTAAPRRSSSRRFRERQIVPELEGPAVVVPDVVGERYDGIRDAPWRSAHRCGEWPLGAARSWSRFSRDVGRGRRRGRRARTRACEQPHRRTGRIFDLGFRRYEGPREGRRRAFSQSTRTGCGRRWAWARRPRRRSCPGSSSALLFSLPASSRCAGAIDRPAPDSTPADRPPLSRRLLLHSSIVLSSSSPVGPELLCPDRRSGAISLYLVRPLRAADTPSDAGCARSRRRRAAWLPQLVLLAGLVLGASDPARLPRRPLAVHPRFLVAGARLAAYFTAFAGLVASFDTRRAYRGGFCRPLRRQRRRDQRREDTCPRYRQLARAADLPGPTPLHRTTWSSAARGHPGSPPPRTSRRRVRTGRLAGPVSFLALIAAYRMAPV